MPLPRRRSTVDDDGLTELGRRWRAVAIAHERLIHAYMFDIVRYRLKLGEDLDHGTLPLLYHDTAAEVHPEPAPAAD